MYVGMFALYNQYLRPKKKQTLSDKLGGFNVIQTVVDAFYVKVLADPELQPFFSHSNMAKQRVKQVDPFLIIRFIV